ncbi:MAG: hypothetical protein ABIZ04_07055 [Opitutus sp.]
MTNTPQPSSHHWKFFRTGGLDQVSLESEADLLALRELDQKLWVALSCPVKGLELDDKTLARIDSDNDGRIRVPELIEAVEWAAARLKDGGELVLGRDSLPLASIDDSSPEGKILVSSARQILSNLGQANATSITVGDAADTAKIFSSTPLNGDGVIPPEATEDPAVQALIKDIISCCGGAGDRTGSVGVTAETISAFFTELNAYHTWIQLSAQKEIAILGDETEPAVNAIKAVRAKVEDYFVRQRLANFEPRAISALNRSEADYLAISTRAFDRAVADVVDFPLARIEPDQPLPLLHGVNPAWSDAVALLHRTAVAPLFGPGQSTLSLKEWSELNARFAPYETWLGSKTGGAVEKLGLARVKEILAGSGQSALADLIAADKRLEPEYKAISDVERLVRYYRDLRALLHNFVNFADFYSPDRLATFQAGTLFIDSRSTELCVRVDAPSPLAAMAKVYIAYCSCTRAGSPPMHIAACFTQGDSDYLFVGRHGVFYDRQGRDWDAVVTSIVDNPISIRQAFWSPYKKFLRMIEEQVAKRAAAADAEATGRLAGAAAQAANADKAKIEPAKKVDVGAVAAIGVAVTGAVSAMTLILGYVFKLALWQYPLVLLGLILLISTPSMIIAWLKLRQRTLGPILEGNGWAVNGRVKINIPFGTKLTETATLPPGSQRSLDDPYEDKEAKRRRVRVLVLTILLVLSAAATFIRWKRLQDGHYFWEPKPVAAVPVTPAAPTTAAPAEAPK